jgi:hypothetical protein
MVTRVPSIQLRMHPAGRAPDPVVQPGCIRQRPLFPRTSENRAQLVPTTSLNDLCDPTGQATRFLNAPAPPRCTHARSHSLD